MKKNFRTYRSKKYVEIVRKVTDIKDMPTIQEVLSIAELYANKIQPLEMTYTEDLKKLIETAKQRIEQKRKDEDALSMKNDDKAKEAEKQDQRTA